MSRRSGPTAFDGGWDTLRDEIFARQKALGVIPANAVMTPRPAEIPAWNDMPEALKPILRRQMEIYAGFLEHVDRHVGRLIDALVDLQILDDTLIFYIIGDNGASAEGSLNGCFNEMGYMNGMPAIETPEFLMSKIDEFGGPTAYNHYAVGWGHALDTPYQWTKQVASHWGGTRNGMVVHWPRGIHARGELRHQFHHVVDIAPTILEVAQLPAPAFVNGIQQAPHEGVSLVYSFNDSKAEDRHETQYFEIFGNRAIYHKGWTAVAKHSTPWVLAKTPALDDDRWELYGPDDWSQSNNLAQEDPARLAELQRLFLIEAAKHNVLPIDDRRAERMMAEVAGRPQLITGSSQVLFGGMGRLTEPSTLNIKNKSYSITAEVEVGTTPAEGVIVAQGGSVGGWSLYAKDGRLKYCYNFLGIKRFFAEGTTAIRPGKHQLRMEFKYDGGGLGKGGVVHLFVDGKASGEGRVDITVPMTFSFDETCDVGKETGSPVSPDYGDRHNEFSGEVNWVQIDLEKDDHDHLISAEERFRVAMARH